MNATDREAKRRADKAYYARCIRQLKEWGAPVTGWRCVDIIDVREDDRNAPLSTCELCGCADVRYEHVMDNDLYFAFTVQEEVGLRGAKVSGFEIAPDIALAIDVTLSGDHPDAESTAAELGKGAAIKVRDRSAICSREIIEDLENIAKRKGISTQRDVLSAGGTDIGSVQLLGKGVQVGGISIPIRYCHSAIEMADRRDIEATVALLTAYLEK